MAGPCSDTSGSGLQPCLLRRVHQRVVGTGQDLPHVPYQHPAPWPAILWGRGHVFIATVILIGLLNRGTDMPYRILVSLPSLCGV
jgi:hypothetical protein